MKKLLFLFITLLCITPSIALGATYYVAKTGSDSNSCANASSDKSAKLTVKAGLACLAGGDTLTIKEGIYTVNMIDNIPSGTSWDNATTIQAAPSETVILQPDGNKSVIEFNKKASYIVFDRLIIDAANIGSGCAGHVKFKDGSGSSHIVFKNGEIRNTRGHAVAGGVTTNDIRILNNKIYNVSGEVPGSTCQTSRSGRTGAHGFYWRSSNGIIEGNEIFNVTGYGIQFYYSKGTLDVANNIFRNNTLHDMKNKGAIVFGDTAKNNFIYNNVIYDVRQGIKDCPNNNKIFNNTIYNVSLDGAKNLGNCEVKNNIAFKAGRVDFGSNASNNLTSQPHFVDSEAGDFHLQSSSPAIDAGITLAEVTNDFDGISRPQGSAYDIGAYEFVGISSSPPPPPACSNGRDDDNDGKVDYPNDPGCTSASDTDETDPPPPPPPSGGTIFSTLDSYIGDAANWQPLTPSRWAVVSDGGDLRYGITTTNYTNLSGSRLGEYSLLKNRTYGDFTFTARVRSTEPFPPTADPNDIGVVFGYQDQNNYYFVLLNTVSKYNEFITVQNGVRIRSVNIPNTQLSDNAYHDINIQRSGSQITVSFDGIQKLAAADSTFGTGQIGIGSFNDASLWDDIQITTPTQPPLPPQPLKGDLNQDNTVNSLDWSIMKSQWLTSNPQSDLNNDGIVNSVDFSILNGEWNMTASP